MPPEDCSAQVTEKKIEGMLLFAAGLKKSPVGSWYNPVKNNKVPPFNRWLD